MAHFPNIPSFFKSEMFSKDFPQTSVMRPAKADDGSTSEEIKATLDSSLPQWQPRREYRQSDIESLVPGPSCVSFRGRVVNLYQQQRSGQMPKEVEGCWRLIVKDDTGAILVNFLVCCTLSIRQANIKG